MVDERFRLAIATLRRLEEAVATVERRPFGGVFRCPVAPTLAPLNFVRVDHVDAEVVETVEEARAAAEAEAVTTIVLDAPSASINIAFEGETLEGEWFRVPRGIYVCETAPLVEQTVRRVTLDDFVDARRAFLDVSGRYDGTQAKEEEEAARLIATKVDTQQWGSYADGELASVGEIYFIHDAAQLESLSTLPRWEGKGLGTAVTAGRVDEALGRGVELVFAQIEADNKRSIRLHERVGFERVGARTTFTLVPAGR
jgi:RimJ/RimL family protein N-acetyltransferase